MPPTLLHHILLATAGALAIATAAAAELEVFHADSLAGPMRALKGAFEAKNPGLTLKLTAGVSRQLAGRIAKGDACDVFAPSSPAVIDASSQVELLRYLLVLEMWNSGLSQSDIRARLGIGNNDVNAMLTGITRKAKGSEE